MLVIPALICSTRQSNDWKFIQHHCRVNVLPTLVLSKNYPSVECAADQCRLCLKTDTKEKADICNRQFHSAFTCETNSDPPSKGASPFSSIGEITVDSKGVAKLLDGLNVHKAPGPDGLNARVLKEYSTQNSPILAFIYNESLAQGNFQRNVPDD